MLKIFFGAVVAVIVLALGWYIFVQPYTNQSSYDYGCLDAGGNVETCRIHSPEYLSLIAAYKVAITEDRALPITPCEYGSEKKNCVVAEGYGEYYTFYTKDSILQVLCNGGGTLCANIASYGEEDQFLNASYALVLKAEDGNYAIAAFILEETVINSQETDFASQVDTD